ncbi:MAG: hypothetical protein A3H96_02225 [Acidobacteria bacterium RIFCSPLOWO2_02_FULL_67_36]|nr:MAG: hypothetical protein A3H96_02225 [Acidobacteria bacterium RIFCSPLOWO2_02_FULL_67_36]
MNAEYQSIPHDDHDRAVLLQALKLLHDGYAVRARVEGYFQLPDPIYGYRPDVVAQTAEGHYVIVEVKKGEVDWPKLEALQRFAAEHPEYELRVIDAVAA